MNTPRQRRVQRPDLPRLDAASTDDDVVLGVAPLFHITGLIAPHRASRCSSGAPLVLVYRFDPAVTLDTIEQRTADVHRRRRSPCSSR